MFGKDAEGNEVDKGQTSILAQGCKFDGNIEVKGAFRVEGEFKGTVQTPENLIIGKTGVIHAQVKVKNAIIAGQLFGNIDAENKIELQSGSHVEGDIRTKRLVIDEGVFFEGNCSMGGEHRRTPAPQPGAPAVAPRAPQPGK